MVVTRGEKLLADSYLVTIGSQALWKVRPPQWWSHEDRETVRSRHLLLDIKLSERPDHHSRCYWATAPRHFRGFHFCRCSWLIAIWYTYVWVTATAHVLYFTRIYCASSFNWKLYQPENRLFYEILCLKSFENKKKVQPQAEQSCFLKVEIWASPQNMTNWTLQASFSSGTRKILCNFKQESIGTLSHCLNLSGIVMCVTTRSPTALCFVIRHVIQIEVI